MTKRPSVTILIPAINETESLRKVIIECLQLTQYAIIPLVVIDSKVAEETKKEAIKSNAKVINIGKGLGKGTAVRLAIPHIKTDYVIQIDADYQFMPYDIPKFMNALLSGYDVALGTR